MMSNRTDARDIAAALTNDVEQLASVLLGEPNRAMSSRREMRWGSRGSHCLKIAGQWRGHWHDFETGQHGDALDLVAYARRSDLREAARWALQWLGEGVDPSPKPPVQRSEFREASARSTVEMARAIWCEAAPPAGTLVERYLTSRGLRLEADYPLRFHPACPRGAERWPAMVALMTAAVTGAAVGIHRTFLASDGSGKAPGVAKKLLGAAGVIRLCSDADVTTGLGIAEGIETAIAVMQRADWRPIWACGSAGAMRTFPILRGVEEVSLFADADDAGAGLAAARDCAQRWQEAGRLATLRIPPNGTDWHDSLRSAA